MAALVVQSRFAGLQIEDDDYPPSRDAQKVKKNKTNTAKKPEPTKKTKNTNNNINPKTQVGNNQNKKKKTKPNNTTTEQWELWKQKDEELVDGNYENELEQAILLSKLDFEEKKDVYKQSKKEAELEKKTEQCRANGKKQKKKTVMSLDQFNDMVANGEEIKSNHVEEKNITSEVKTPEPDKEFFERVQDDAKTEILKDKIIDRVRHRQPVSDEVINRVQFAVALEKKDDEIAALRQVVTTLKDELRTVKCRNTQLYKILGQGEMKDKAEVLVEVERLLMVQDELTTELANLHSQLERERSKNTDTRPNHKKKKGGSSEKEK